MHPVYQSKLGEGRRVAIPAELCEKIGLHPGDPVALELHEDGLHVIPYAQIIREVQSAFAPYRLAGKSTVDELLRERRQEAKREERE